MVLYVQHGCAVCREAELALGDLPDGSFVKVFVTASTRPGKAIVWNSKNEPLFETERCFFNRGFPALGEGGKAPSMFGLDEIESWARAVATLGGVVQHIPQARGS